MSKNGPSIYPILTVKPVGTLGFSIVLPFLFASSFGAVSSIVGLLAGGVLYAALGVRIFLVSVLVRVSDVER